MATNSEKIVVKAGSIYEIVLEGHEDRKENEGVTLVVEDGDDGTALLTEFHAGAVTSATSLTLV